jgi:predicted benzoate:H+ symporter BenE
MNEWFKDLLAMLVAAYIGYLAAEAVGAIIAAALVIIYGGSCYLDGFDDAERGEQA